MFIGQFAVGLAVKKFFVLIPVIHAPRLWICSATPGSHSLAMSLVWATAFAAIYHRAVRYWPGTLAIWIGVVSHGLLDGVTLAPICRSIRVTDLV